MWQLRLSDLTEHDKTIIGVLITNLDDDGYLRLPLEEAAFMAGADLEETERLPPSRSRPSTRPASRARSLSECLLFAARAARPGEFTGRRPWFATTCRPSRASASTSWRASSR